MSNKHFLITLAVLDDRTGFAVFAHCRFTIIFHHCIFSYNITDTALQSTSMTGSSWVQETRRVRLSASGATPSHVTL